MFQLVDARAPELFAQMLTRAAEEEGLLPEKEEGAEDALEATIAESMSLGIRREALETQRAEEALERDRRPLADAIAERRRQIEEGDGA